MLAKASEARQEKMSSGTYDAVCIAVNIQHTTANTALVPSDFNPALVQVKATLKRKNQPHIIMQDNLQVLGVFSTLTSRYNEFFNGIDKITPAAGKKAVSVRLVKINFGGPVRVNQGDELILEVSPSSACFSGNVDATSSFIEFYANPTIGYEQGLPSIMSEVVQATTTKQPFNPGDNIYKLAVLNFDKNDYADEVINNIALQSDRLDLSMSFNQLLVRHSALIPDSSQGRFGTALPVSLGAPTVRRGLDYLPQSFLIYDGIPLQKELDSVRVDIGFNGAQVAASMNYVVWSKIAQTLETVMEAAQREQKHDAEKLQKLGA